MKTFFLAAAAIIGAAILPASAQMQTWKDTSTYDTCGYVTTNQMQNIPSAGFGIGSEGKTTFYLMVRGYMDVGHTPQDAEIVFANRRTKATRINFAKVDEPNLYGMALYLDLDYLKDIAESDRFHILLEGNPFATYALAERGQLIVSFARCMRQLP